MKDYATSAIGQAVLRLTKMLSYIYAFIQQTQSVYWQLVSSRSGALGSTERSSWNHLMDERIDE